MADADKSMSKSVENVREKPGQLKDWQIRQKWLRLELNCGSRYPPFCIEPLPLERQRLSGAGMSDKDRALRRQWVKDQILSPDEPREVPALRPYNIFRRIYRAPANFIFSSLTPMIGNDVSAIMRNAIPKCIIGTMLFYWALYHLKYHQNDWTRNGGWSVYNSKPVLYSDDAELPPKQFDDFYNRGFKSRTVLRDFKTSSV